MWRYFKELLLKVERYPVLINKCIFLSNGGLILPLIIGFVEVTRILVFFFKMVLLKLQLLVIRVYLLFLVES